MSVFVETKSDIITTAHTVMAATLQEHHDITPMHKHYFISMVSRGIEAQLEEMQDTCITEAEVIAMVEISFDVSRTIAESGGLVYTKFTEVA